MTARDVLFTSEWASRTSSLEDNRISHTLATSGRTSDTQRPWCSLSGTLTLRRWACPNYARFSRTNPRSTGRKLTPEREDSTVARGALRARYAWGLSRCKLGLTDDASGVRCGGGATTNLMIEEFFRSCGGTVRTIAADAVVSKKALRCAGTGSMKSIKSKKLKRTSAPAISTSYPALPLKQNDNRFYFTTMPVDDLFRYCFVARRDEDAAAGFQRALSESRADDIANYLASGEGSIPTNVVLSAQAVADLSYSRATKTLSFERTVGAFLVLDGQHRLWGYEKCGVRHRVPVAIYQGLTRQQEARLFIDINTTQRGVPAALLLDIKQLAALESQKEEVLRGLFDRFSDDPRSPLAGKLSASKSIAGKVSRVTFNRAVSQALESSHVAGLDDSTRYRLFLNYLRSFEAELRNDDKALLVRSAFFEAMFDVFDEVLRTTVAAKEDLKVESLRAVIQPLATIDLSGSTTTPTKKAITTLMHSTLHKSIRISKEML